MVVLSAADNVGIALADIAGDDLAEALDGRSVEAGETIPLGHKVALRPIAAGEEIVRFGVPVGIATLSIDAGRLVHVHNVRSRHFDNDENHYE